MWELDPGRFQLTNPKWEQCVAAIVAQVQEALGLRGQKLTTQLYKLLVYEQGSFFLPHRDGEKLDRMVATLLIGLPSVHDGGELIVWHDGREHQVERSDTQESSGWAAGPAVGVVRGWSGGGGKGRGGRGQAG
ncbi:MAG: 2OG-Fe(II) oxygenase [Pirellulaceae bacterium]|nr:2OG-Fe(II) oxygenase [Pirellulaceae bacterium]